MKSLIIFFALTIISSSSYGMDYGSGCSRNTGTYANEKLCLKLKVPSEKSAACGTYTGTYANERLCLKYHRLLTVDMIYECGRSTTSYYDERSCLKDFID